MDPDNEFVDDQLEFLQSDSLPNAAEDETLHEEDLYSTEEEDEKE